MQPAPEHELLYSPALVHRSVRVFVRQRLIGHQPGLWLAQAGLLTASTTLAFIGSVALAMLFAAFAILPILLVLIGWAAHDLHHIRRLRAMGVPVAWLALGPEDLRFRSEAGTMRLRYSEILEVVKRRDFWLLVMAPNQFATLPIASLPPRTLDVMRARILEATADR